MSSEEGAPLPSTLKIEMSAQRHRERERREEINGEEALQNGGEIWMGRILDDSPQPVLQFLGHWSC
jgi:hypothetical protein